MKKVLVAGVNGYLGGIIANHLYANGFCVDGIGTTKFEDQRLSLVVNNYFQLQNDFATTNLDLKEYSDIVYCISLDHNKTEENYSHSIEVNVGLLASLLNEIRDQDVKPRITYLSTMQVYRDQDYRKSFVEPYNLYGCTHVFCEHILKLYTNSSILRLANVYGPPKTERANIEWTLIPSLCKSVVKNQTIEIKNNGLATRNFLFSRDLQSIVVDQIETSQFGYREKNIVGKSTTSVGYIKKLIESIGKQRYGNITSNVPEGYHYESETQITDIENKDKDNEIENLIGKTTLEEGILETLKYFEGRI